MLKVINDILAKLGVKRKTNEGWTWFCHHDRLLEYCDNFADRAKYIKETKPSDEISIRINAFRFVKGKLPKKLLKAHAVLIKAYAKSRKAWEGWVAVIGTEPTDTVLMAAYLADEKARDEYVNASKIYMRAYAVYEPEIIALFKKECPDVELNEDLTLKL